MFDKHTHTLIAQRLDQAEKQREQIRAISLDYPEITIEDAYAVQREWVRLKIAEGRTLKGHKIGLTSKAMQASSQISEPDYGALLDDMLAVMESVGAYGRKLRESLADGAITADEWQGLNLKMQQIFTSVHLVQARAEFFRADD